MTRLFCILAAALPLAAQTDLDREYRRLLADPQQPAWIAWRVPAARSGGNNCDYVHESNVVHLEPAPDAIVLFRIEGQKLDRIRSMSGHCEIDAGGL